MVSCPCITCKSHDTVPRGGGRESTIHTLTQLGQPSGLEGLLLFISKLQIRQEISEPCLFSISGPLPKGQRSSIVPMMQ